MYSVCGTVTKKSWFNNLNYNGNQFRQNLGRPVYEKGGGGVNWNILKMNSHQCFLIVEFHTINSYCSQFDPEKILPVYFCYM